jgi:uncharacterized protein DUF4126
VTALLTGLGLAAAAGLNAWAVLLLFQGLVRLLPQEFPGATTAFLSSPVVLQAALVLVLAEFIVNKIPFLDRFWESAHTLLRPVVGVLLALACLPESAGFARVGAGVAAALATLGAHLAKSASRFTSTAAIRGSTQFLLSLAEDVVAVVLATLCFFQPWFTAILLAGLATVLLLHLPRVGRTIQMLLFRLQHPRRGNL